MVDVVVVGGGPAACAAALALRTGGARTTVVASPRWREKPTETSVARLRPLLQSIGAAAALEACEPCYGIESNWGLPETRLQPSILDPSGHAWFIHRRRFDACLGRLVDQAGAVRIEAQAETVRFVAEGVVVETTAGPVSARHLIIASGSPAWAARVTGQKTVQLDSLVCYWSRLRVSRESRLLQVESSAQGWWYLCPGEENTAVVCFLTDAGGARELAPSEPANWNRLLAGTELGKHLPGSARAESVQVLPVGVAGLAERQGPFWTAAGDAALKLDPIGSSGTATALESALRAARLVLGAATDRPAQAESYDRWIKGLLATFLKHRNPLYAAAARKYPGGFWARRG